MSRTGRLPISVPQGVKISVENNMVRVQGPKGELQRQIPESTILRQEEDQVIIQLVDDGSRTTAMQGLARSLVANMVEGVTKGFQKSLELVGVGYRASLQGEKLVLNLGYSQPVEYESPKTVDFELEGNNKITVRGIDKDEVGRVTAEIRAFRKPEPYKGKGIRYEGETVRLKAGKAGLKK